MALTEASIKNCKKDGELFDMLSEELQERLPAEDEGGDVDLLLKRIRGFPAGLRAMAATYQLEMTMSQDDLGWFFAQWHHCGYCEETLWGLRELGAAEEADIFAQAYAAAQPHWDTVGKLIEQDFENFVEWYPASALQSALRPLNERMWRVCEAGGNRIGLFRHWVSYARANPGNVL